MGVIHRFHSTDNGELRWQDVPLSAYGPDNSRADRATRQVLIGTQEEAPHFHLRYFAVQPGGYTSLDQHVHDHGVYVLHGKARLRLGDEEQEVYLSLIHISEPTRLGMISYAVFCLKKKK